MDINFYAYLNAYVIIIFALLIIMAFMHIHHSILNQLKESLYCLILIMFS